MKLNIIAIKFIPFLKSNNLNILIFILTLLIFLATNPFRLHYWSADHEFIILNNILNLNFQSIEYDHTGLVLFIFLKILFQIFSLFSENISSDYSSFMNLLDEKKFLNHIFLIRFFNFFIIFFIIFFLNKIFLALTNDKFLSLALSITVLLSKPILGFFYEVRTDTMSILLFLLAIYLLIIPSYRFLIAFFLSLTYVNKVNFIPYILIFPLIKLLFLKIDYKNINFDFFNKFIIFFGIWSFFYFIIFFNITINSQNSFNTHIPLSNLSFFYQFFILGMILLSYNFFGFNFSRLTLANAFFGISLSIILASFFIDKYVLTLLFNPFEHMIRYTPGDKSILGSAKKLLIADFVNYTLLIKDNLLFISVSLTIVICNIYKIIKYKFSYTDLIPILIFLIINFQFMRGYFLRYESIFFILMVIYLSYIARLLSKKFNITMAILLLICSFYFPAKLVFGKILYDPFTPQDINVACDMGRDWVKGKLGLYMQGFCK